MTEAPKVALVTGASRGIGAATACQLARDGMDVVLAARSKDDLAAVGKQVEALGRAALVVPTDISSTDDLDALMAATRERFGRLDVLINNAGVLPAAVRSEQVALDDFRRMLDINLLGPFYLAGRAHDLMLAGGAGGVILNVSSTAAIYPSMGFSVYNATKAALSMVTKTMALEWARDGIRVLGITPGKVETVLVEPILAYGERKGLRVNPMGRIGQPEEVADLISFLVSDRAAYITGSIVTIDGGEVLSTGAGG